MTSRTTLVAALLLAATATTLLAEKVPMSPAQLRKTATHVVTGKVLAIYSRQTTEGMWQVTRFCAEVQVTKAEKGEGTAAGSLVYVRYWTRLWTGGRTPPPGTNGHRGLPAEGQTLRIYLARNAYDGFSDDNKDGGFNVIGANGFEAVD